MNIVTLLQNAGSLAADVPNAETTAAQGWMTAIVALLLIVGVFAVSYVFQMGNIARATFKEAVRQPLFLLLLGVGTIVLLLNTIVPFFSLGEDIKMLKDCGLATILISGLLLAIWTSSTSIASEIEGKTAMTLLSKPINRRQFILGKYFGILQSTLALVLPMALAFLLCIYFKVPYDARESGGERLEMFDWSYVLSLGFTEFRVPMPGGLQIAEIVLILPGIALVILEIAVMAAIAVAISTRLPMVANMVTCLTIFVIGHLTPILVEAGVMKVEFVKFMAQLIATVLPSLEVFNISAAIATSVDVPPAYLGGATVFCAAYSTAAILFAFILFEDRDLA